MGKIYGIVSGKGGVGKTTSTINLAAALTTLGEDATVIDSNFSTPNIGIHLGSPIVPLTLNHILEGKVKTKDALYEYQGMKVILSSLALNASAKHWKLVTIGKQLKRLSDNIFIDSSAGIGEEVRSVIHASDEVIIITQAEMPSVTDALKTVKLTEQLGKEVRGFIITRHKKRRSEMKIESIKDMLEVPLLGIIPEDKKIQKALSLKNSVIFTHPRSKSARAYKKIAKKLIG